ncbi:MAG: hypothetical protein HQ488_01800 [Parcubacteria group bacterium]|nr:hypothetical protein [Parcubacteria group bacterium]
MSLMGARLELRLRAAVVESTPDEDYEDIDDLDDDPVVRITDLSEVRCLDMYECEDFFYTLAHELGLTAVPVGDYVFTTSLQGLEVVEVPEQWGDKGCQAIMDRFPVGGRALQQELITSLVEWPLAVNITEAAKMLFQGALSLVAERLGSGDELAEDFLTIKPLSPRENGAMEIMQTLVDEIMVLTSPDPRGFPSLIVEVVRWEPSPVGNWLNAALATAMQETIKDNKKEWVTEWLVACDARLVAVRADAEARFTRAASQNEAVRALFASDEPAESDASEGPSFQDSSPTPGADTEGQSQHGA